MEGANDEPVEGILAPPNPMTKLGFQMIVLEAVRVAMKAEALS
jgi:hypothetical protein